jgi:hypothetical protein
MFKHVSKTAFIATVVVLSSCSLTPSASDFQKKDELSFSEKKDVLRGYSIEDLNAVGRVTEVTADYKLSGQIIGYRSVYLLYPFEGGLPTEVYLGGSWAADALESDTKLLTIVGGSSSTIMRCKGTGTSCKTKLLDDGGVEIILLK